MDRLAAKALLLFSVVWITGKLRTFFFFFSREKIHSPSSLLSSLNFDFKTIRTRKREIEFPTFPSSCLSLSLSGTVKRRASL